MKILAHLFMLIGVFIFTAGAPVSPFYAFLFAAPFGVISGLLYKHVKDKD